MSDAFKAVSGAPVEAGQKEDDGQGRPALSEVGHHRFAEVRPGGGEVEQIVDQLEGNADVATELEELFGEMEC